MNIQDRRGSFTAEELRQKYNLDGLIKDRKAIELNKEGLTQVQNEQNNILEALILSLNGIEIQSEITLWFFNDIPTLGNTPALAWENDETKNEHIGDLYYDRDTGYVYQFQLNDEVYEWVQQTNSNLIQAMALTNATIDTDDNFRRVFLDSPIPPYSNGDWYILENGDLKICQISKDNKETYEEKDFIIASKYVIGTQAQEMNNKIIITAGQVTIIEAGIDEINTKIEDNKYYTDENGEQQLISSAITEFAINTEGITSTVSETTNTVSSLTEALYGDPDDDEDEGLISKMETVRNVIANLNTTIFEQSSTAFQMYFAQTGLTTTLENIEEILSDSTATLKTVEQYIRFEEGAMLLGRSDSQNQIRVTNERISFLSGLGETAYITGNNFFMNSGVIVLSLQIGGWIDEVDSYGNLNTRWVGDM